MLAHTAWGETAWRMLRESMTMDMYNPQSIAQAVFGTRHTVLAGEEDPVAETDLPPLDIRIIKPLARPNQTNAKGISVLIYHTHTSEAYAKQPLDTYTETGEWRSTDNAHNIVRVGTELKDQLESNGFSVYHALTDHEPPKLSTAYTRSVQTMQAAQAQAPIDLFIDVHRDAYIAELRDLQTVDVQGQPAARMMFVVAMGEGDMYVEKPDWRRNYALAKQITDAVNAEYPDLMKQPMLRTDRFNQHMGLVLLVEIGNNCNALSEALAAVPPLAHGINACAEAIAVNKVTQQPFDLTPR